MFFGSFVARVKEARFGNFQENRDRVFFYFDFLIYAIFGKAAHLFTFFVYFYFFYKRHILVMCLGIPG